MPSKEEAFIRAKLKRIFAMKDQNGNGKVELDDILIWGRKAAQISNIDFTPDLEAKWTKVYNSYFPHEVGQDIEKWMDNVISFSKLPNAVDITQDMTDPVFDVVDVNGDGMLSWEEFYAFIQPLGVSEVDARHAFEMIDENKDGKLSRNELAKANAHYYFDATPSKYMHFYGVLELDELTEKQFDQSDLCLSPPQPVLILIRALNRVLPSFLQKKTSAILLPNEPIELYTVPFNTCPYSARAMIVLIELDIPFHKIEVPFKLPDKSGKSYPPAWYYDLNPRGKTPTLRLPAHDNKVVYESSIVTHFLCDYSSTMENKDAHLLPTDPFDKSKMALLNDHADNTLIPSIFTYLMGKDKDNNVLRDKMEEGFSIFERALEESGGPYLLGNQFTLADAHLVPFMYRMDVALKHFKNYEVNKEKFPKLLDWYETCRKLKSVYRAECTSGAIIENFRHFIEIDYDFGGLVDKTSE